MSTSFLKKYKIIDKIGEGSFSEVVKCQDRETGELFAAKRLKKTFQTVAEAVAIPEVIAMRKMSRHPNILHLLEQHFDEMPGKVTLIFELMDMSMYDLIKSRKRPPAETRVKNYMYQLLMGCYHLHHNGIFHRDIKPENILIKGDQVKLGDLGSIRGVYSRPPYTEYISTRWYRSPECLLTTGFYGPKMDVWACGCVFYELVTLKPLFPGENELDQIARIHTVLGTPHATVAAKFRRHKSRNCETFFPPKCGSGLHTLLATISESGRDLMRHMLIYDPEHRSNVRRLLDHRYFADLREMEVSSGKSSMTSTTPSSSAASVDWRASYTLSMGDRRRRAKRSYSSKRAIEGVKMDVANSGLGGASSGVILGHRLPRQVISSPSQRQARLAVRRRNPSQDQFLQRPLEEDHNVSHPSPARQPARTRLLFPAAGRVIQAVRNNQKLVSQVYVNLLKVSRWSEEIFENSENVAMHSANLETLAETNELLATSECRETSSNVGEKAYAMGSQEKSQNEKQNRNLVLQQRQENFVYFEQMRFRQPVNKPTKTSMGDERTDDDADSNLDPDNPQSLETDRPTTQSNKRKKSSDEYDILLQTLKSRCLLKNSDSDDEDRLFMLSLVPELKRIPNHVKLDIKSQLLDVLSKARREVQQHGERRQQQLSFPAYSTPTSHGQNGSYQGYHGRSNYSGQAPKDTVHELQEFLGQPLQGTVPVTVSPMYQCMPSMTPQLSSVPSPPETCTSPVIASSSNLS